ncbi:MAG TPA: heparan-alpha-glucosaminide N-acetyltransferase domain-containing protein [Terracidiphilus sp.]|nr:heparan-alpha-glucosaminide N-acetyltransferase domain-containing protein [Terracidiphilus sp.]
MDNPALTKTPLKRLLSLDAARGITIAFMIMVNNNGGEGSWHFMNHAVWNGLTPTDLVFPTFIFVVGVSVVFAFESRLARGATKASLARHTVQRAVILILFGIVVNNFPFFQWQHMRFYGVLQRIGICYLVVGLFYLWDNRAWTKVAALVVALVGYWALVRWAPIPGVGMPGRDVPFMDMTQNIVSWVDRHLFPYHLYLNWPLHNTRDPEGLLSDIPAIGTALVGVLTGLWLRTARATRQKALGMLAAAVASPVLGYLWSLEFPLNKNMWTSSYVLVAAGYSLLLFTLCYWAAEVMDWRKGWSYIWLVFGSNAITAYMISELGADLLWSVKRTTTGGITISPNDRLVAWEPGFFQHTFARIPNPHWAAFAYSVIFTALCFIPVWIMYRRKIFLKV